MGTTKEARLNLLAAERHFLDAITEDNRFDLAHYNLRWCTALDRPAAALARSSARWSSIRCGSTANMRWHACAQPHGATGQTTMAAHAHLRLALDHCDRALALAGDAEARAKTLNQKAITQKEVSPEDFFIAAAHCRAAVRAALRSLLGAELAVFQRPELAQRRRTQARDLASSSLQQLWFILRIFEGAIRSAPGLSARWLFITLARRQRLGAARLAAWLTPNDFNAHLALGSYWLQRGRPSRAIPPLRRAAQIAPEKGEVWCALAVANAKLFREDQVIAAFVKAVDAVQSIPDTALQELARALRIMAAGTRYFRMQIASVGRRLKGRGRLRGWLWIVGFQYRMAYFLSGRRLRRWQGYMYLLQMQLGQGKKAIAQLDALIKKRREQASRFRQLPQRRDEVSALSGEETDRSAELEKHYKEAMDHEWMWEAGDAASALGKVAMRFGRPADACQWYETAIKVFGPNHRTELGRRGLHALRARSLVGMGKPGAALDAARLAVEIDPVGSFERDRLAECHFYLREWAAARREWQESLRAAPDQPGTYHNIALCWSREADSADSAAERRACFVHAATNFDRALSLFPTSDPQRLDSQFELGRIKCTIGDVRDGQALWQALESRQYRPLYLGLHLADSMLREVSLEQAQAQFERWSTHVADKAKESPDIMHQPIDGVPGDTTTHAEALVWSELGIAAAIAGRQGGFDVALRHVENARTATAQIQDAASRERWLAQCDRIGGEVLLRQGQAARAAPLFESALLKTTSFHNYRFLAAALLDQLKPSAADAKARVTALRIRSLLDHAVKLDLDEEAKQPIAELRRRLASTAAGKAIAWTTSEGSADGARASRRGKSRSKPPPAKRAEDPGQPSPPGE